VQVWFSPAGTPWPADDPYFTAAPWADVEVLPPQKWGAADPSGALGFDPAGRPKAWPMRLTKVHWAALLPGRPAGEYVLRCRTVDAKGHAQPMPRPFRKSGHCAIEEVALRVKA